uniref:Calpain catalytic domain-containing protein n=1 Tax=Tetranychus urticae TaxID=32264 RepID=T1KNX4_TETUR
MGFTRNNNQRNHYHHHNQHHHNLHHPQSSHQSKLLGTSSNQNQHHQQKAFILPHNGVQRVNGNQPNVITSSSNGNGNQIGNCIDQNGSCVNSVPIASASSSRENQVNQQVAPNNHNTIGPTTGVATATTKSQQQSSGSSNSANHNQNNRSHQVNPPSSSSSSTTSSTNYSYLRRLCRERGILFEDATFTPGNRSLYGKKDVPSSSSCNFMSKISSSIVWMRPYEICSRPKFISSPSPEGTTSTSPTGRFDVEQGEAIIAITACSGNNKSSSSSPSSLLIPSLSSSSTTNHHVLSNGSGSGGGVGNGNINGGHSGLSGGIIGNANASSSSSSPANYLSSKTTCSSLLSAISCLTLTPSLLDRVVPSDQSFSPSSYSGIFRFRFWRFGDWTEVIIDDRLPTYKGRLLFLRSADPTEFWVPLLEKAYSKMYGSYDYYLKNCFTAQTLQDLTGGIAQSFTIPHHDGHIIYQMISSAVPRSTLLSACISSIPPNEAPASLLSLSGGASASTPFTAFSSSYLSSGLSVAMNKLQPARLRNGLITRQAYSITGLARVRTQTRPVVLIRLKNAWGKGEWNGPWSERSWEWDTLTDRDKEELSARCRDDGEFWMSFDDFLRFFTHLDLVHIGPDDWMAETALHHKRPWRAVLARRRWRYGFNAGGSPEYKDTFSTNPQFHIHIPKNGLNKCHVVVSVTQNYLPIGLTVSATHPFTKSELQPHHLHHAHHHHPYHYQQNQQLSSSFPTSSPFISQRNQGPPINLYPIGFCVYEVPPGMKRLTSGFIAAHRPLDVTAFTCTRETVTFFTLPPGDFIIVPSTEKPHCETKFLLRILTDEPSTIWEVNDDNVIFTDISIPKVIENTGQNGHNVLNRLIAKLPNEIDAALLLKVLKAYWKPLNILYDKPSMELCRCLIMLKDATITGKLVVTESLASLLNMLHFWRTIFTKHQSNSHHKVSSYNFRLVLWEAGISVSNKVLECLVIRYTNNCALLNLESYLLSLVKLHLAHDRYRSLERKGKNQNLTLEEIDGDDDFVNHLLVIDQHDGDNFHL